MITWSAVLIGRELVPHLDPNYAVFEDYERS